MMEKVERTLSLDSVTDRLRVKAPLALAIGELADGLADFLAAWPQLQLDVDFKDDFEDLNKDDYDLAFRVTTAFHDPSHIARRIYDYRLHVCCSPAYLEQVGPLTEPEQLAQQRCFTYNHAHSGEIWPLHYAGSDSSIAVPNCVSTNNAIFVRALIRKGLGIGFLPTFVCRDGLASGELIELFPYVARPKLTLFAIYPTEQTSATIAARCVAHLKRWYVDHYSDEIKRPFG